VSPILLHHSTPERNVEAIKREGLKPHQPAKDGNYVGALGLDKQPRGIYAYPDGFTLWSNRHVFTFCYCGPLLRDKVIESAVVVPEPIPADRLTYRARLDEDEDVEVAW
jgi:hypothetical protein